MVTKRTSPKRRQGVKKIPPGPRREDYDSFWEWAIAMGESIPESERYGLPDDGSVNLDHYLYGTPKKVP